MPSYPRLLLLCLTLFLGRQLHANSSFWTAHESDTVQWRHWNADTLEEAKSSDKPLFFFVGHYGNSLARSMLSETFQNATIANTVNETVIPVLVDINEEPELAALLGQMASEHFSANELPTCLWTDTHLAPLNGGGYFPPTDDWGGQGFLSLARNVSEQWNSNRDDYLVPARERLEMSLSKSPTTPESLKDLSNAFPTETFAVKEAPTLSALALYNTARYASHLPKDPSTKLRAELQTFISRITSGAGFDSIEGGFFIGSNDPNWKLPLFQKSTSDQAYLLLALSELYQQDPKPEYKFIIELSVRFIERSLLKENGLALQYIDSLAAGETPDIAEGSYYLVEGSEVPKLDSTAAAAWGLSPEGNLDDDTDILGIYKGLNVPYAATEKVLSHEFDTGRKSLQKLRSTKKPPLSDKTGYTATNALLARALAIAAQSTQTSRYAEIAAKLLQDTLDSNAKLAAAIVFNADSKERKANSNDYTQLAAAALSLYDATNDPQYLDTAKAVYHALQNDPRFHGATLSRPLGVDDIEAALYHDSQLESPIALHLWNLEKLGQNDAASQQEILSAMPTPLLNDPASLQSLSLYSRGQSHD